MEVSQPDAASASHEAIARRAYVLFVQRGYEHGHDLDDWLTAEAELGDSGQSFRPVAQEGPPSQVAVP
jgi:hypothetical protein